MNLQLTFCNVTSHNSFAVLYCIVFDLNYTNIFITLLNLSWSRQIIFKEIRCSNVNNVRINVSLVLLLLVIFLLN